MKRIKMEGTVSKDGIEILEYLGGGVYKCKCPHCGRIFQAKTEKLRNRTLRSCGCKQYDSIRKIKALADHPNSANTTGYTGVFLRPSGAYEVELTYLGKKMYIGSYRTIHEAVAARQDALIQLFG